MRSIKFSSFCRSILVTVFILAVAGVAIRRIAAVRAADGGATSDATISTIAGGGLGSNVKSKAAPMVQPTVVVLDPLGRGFYVVDEVNNSSLLRFVNTSTGPVTLAGTTILPKQINLVAGGGLLVEDGTPAREADLSLITGVAAVSTGNVVFLTAPALSSIIAINVGTEVATVFGKTVAAGTVKTIATLDFADFRGITIHPTTGELYFIAEREVYRFDQASALAVVAGGGNPETGNGDGGTATAARLITPMALAFDQSNNLLIAEGGDVRSMAGAVRRVNSNKIISSLATKLEFPTGITVAPNGDAFVALGNAKQVIRLTPGGVRTLVAGNSNLSACDLIANPTCGDGGPANQSYLNLPASTAGTTLVLAADANGIYLPDYRFKRVRFVNLTAEAINLLETQIPPHAINTIVGNGIDAPYDGMPATSAELFYPTGVAVDSAGNLFLSDTNNNRLRFVNRNSAPITLFSNTPFALTAPPGQIITLNQDVGEDKIDDRITTAFFVTPQGLAATQNGILIVDSRAGSLIRIPPTSLNGKRSGIIRFLNTSNSDVTFFPNNSEAKVVIPPGQIKDLAGVRSPNNPQSLGDGLAANKVAFYPTDVAIDREGNILVADQGNNRIRRINASTGIVSTIYGDGSAATLNGATGIEIDGFGRLYLADTNNDRILRQNSPGSATFSVIADNTKTVYRPRDLAVDGTGQVMITNSQTHQILRLEAPNNSLGTVSVLAGAGGAGFAGDDGPAELSKIHLPNPGTSTNDIQYTSSIIALSNGDLIFTDSDNNRIRMIDRKSGITPVASVSAASFAGNELASESIIAAFGENMATTIQPATSTPLPTSVAGTTVKITDFAGTPRLAPLFFVSPNQINYQIPPGTVTGPALVTVTGGNSKVSNGLLNIANIAPGLFTADSSGKGVAAAVVLRVKQNGNQTYEPVAQFDPGQNKFVPAPIDLGPATDQLFLILFGTGARFRSSLSAVTAKIGGVNAEVLFTGPAEGFVGLDQANIRIPGSLAGRGLVEVILTVDQKPANPITMQIK